VALLKIQVVWGVTVAGRMVAIFWTFIVSLFSGSGSQREADLEDEDTIVD